ncbi:MAG: PrsW family intramembrane metalloprotease, partial [Erysipelotrichaceae bacterium]|nr:PrsW family intramembrane metalloprotease [Erysipelotrichaceae bacterium]
MAAVFGMDYTTAAIAVSPVVEEVIKLLPTLFFLLVFEPERWEIPYCPVMIAAGFATLENVCYLVQNGTSDFFSLLIRGFGTGTMHMFCGTVTFVGILLMWDKLWLRICGSLGLLAVSITYHGIYNMLVLQPGIASYIGYLIPLLSVTLTMVQIRHLH